MRRRERLVQVDVHHVEAHVARPAYTEHRVQVGSVVIHQSAAVVDELRNLRYLGLEEAERVGVGHHHGGDSVAAQRTDALEVSQVDGAVGLGLHFYYFQAADGGRSRIGAVSRVGHDDLLALQVTPRAVIVVDGHQSRQLAVGTGVRLEGEVSQARQFAERTFQ